MAKTKITPVKKEVPVKENEVPVKEKEIRVSVGVSSKDILLKELNDHTSFSQKAQESLNSFLRLTTVVLENNKMNPSDYNVLGVDEVNNALVLQKKETV